MYDPSWAKTGWITFLIGFICLYSPMFYLGMKGMPRRYYDYLPEFHGPNIISSLGALIMVSGFAIILINLIKSSRNGEKAEANPWGSNSLEWQVPSPPPLENWDEIPVVDRAPYKFD